MNTDDSFDRAEAMVDDPSSPIDLTGLEQLGRIHTAATMHCIYFFNEHKL